MWKATKMCWFDDLEIQIESRFFFVKQYFDNGLCRYVREYLCVKWLECKAIEFRICAT